MRTSDKFRKVDRTSSVEGNNRGVVNNLKFIL